MKTSNAFLSITLALAGVMASDAVQAADLCATEQETEQVRAFFEQNPGAVPFSAARRLGLAEAKVAAALPAEQAVSAPGSAFGGSVGGAVQSLAGNFPDHQGEQCF